MGNARNEQFPTLLDGTVNSESLFWPKQYTSHSLPAASPLYMLLSRVCYQPSQIIAGYVGKAEFMQTSRLPIVSSTHPLVVLEWTSCGRQGGGDVFPLIHEAFLLILNR